MVKMVVPSTAYRVTAEWPYSSLTDRTVDETSEISRRRKMSLESNLIIIVIIAFKGAIRDFLQSPHSAANCLQHVRSTGQGTCNTSSAYHVQVSSYVPLGTKGQLSYFDRVEIAFI